MNSNPMLESALNAIFESVIIESPSAYSIGGQRFSVTGATLAASLETRLYSLCYSREMSLSADTGYPLPDPDDNLAMLLSAANQTRERWDWGWKIIQTMPDGSLHAQKESASRLLWPGEYEPMEAGAAVTPAAWVRAFLAKEDLRSQPGFYIAQPERTLTYEDHQFLVRFYWNVHSEGAPDLLAEITGRFNRLRVPFQFKTLRYRNQYDRGDAAVLFVTSRQAGIACRLGAEIHRRMTKRLRPGVPLFTRRLAPGLGFAENPSNGESFGMHRCRLLAESIQNAWEKGSQSPSERIAEFRSRFEAEGLSAATPYLSHSLVDHYFSDTEFASL